MGTHFGENLVDLADDPLELIFRHLSEENCFFKKKGHSLSGHFPPEGNAVSYK